MKPRQEASLASPGGPTHSTLFLLQPQSGDGVLPKVASRLPHGSPLPGIGVVSQSVDETIRPGNILAWSEHQGTATVSPVAPTSPGAWQVAWKPEGRSCHSAQPLAGAGGKLRPREEHDLYQAPGSQVTGLSLAPSSQGRHSAPDREADSFHCKEPNVRLAGRVGSPVLTTTHIPRLLGRKLSLEAKSW